jgi:predicted lipoprotein with Yx(FWY)xxD motif
VRALSLAAALAVASSIVFATGAVSSTGADMGTVKARASAYGRILFDGRGFALYAFTRDKSGRSNCASACASRWPPYVVASAPHAGAGAVASRLGTIVRSDGRRQVTYAGKPLYRYIGDRKPLQVLCQNVSEFGGLWLVVRPNGTLVR